MTLRVLVAINDSAPAFAAAALAVKLAKSYPAELNFTTVSEPTVDKSAVLNHVASLALAAGLEATTTVVEDGQPFEALLATAHEWRADLIIMGRSDVRRFGQPYVGSQTEHLLEFTGIPVLVVPVTPGPGST